MFWAMRTHWLTRRKYLVGFGSEYLRDRHVEQYGDAQAITATQRKKLRHLPTMGYWDVRGCWTWCDGVRDNSRNIDPLTGKMSDYAYNGPIR